MNPSPSFAALLLALAIVSAIATASAGAIAQLDAYRQQGVESVDAQRGRELWYATNAERGCTSCHGETPAMAGDETLLQLARPPRVLTFQTTRSVAVSKQKATPAASTT